MKNAIVLNFDDFIEVVHVLDKNLKYVEQLGMDEGTIQAYRKVLAYLRGRSEADVEKILGIKTSETTSKQKSVAVVPKLTDAEFQELPPSRVLALIADEKLPRAFLEEVATRRFGLTKSGISSLRTRAALFEKMARMLDHEATHQSIARAASGAADESPPTSKDLVHAPWAGDMKPEHK